MRMPITGDDVTLDRVVPITEDFIVEEVPFDGIPVIGADVTVRLLSKYIDLQVQLPFGSRTREFLLDVNRSFPGVTGVSSPQFLWLKKYLQKSFPSSFFFDSRQVNDGETSGNLFAIHSADTDEDFV